MSHLIAKVGQIYSDARDKMYVHGQAIDQAIVRGRTVWKHEDDGTFSIYFGRAADTFNKNWVSGTNVVAKIYNSAAGLNGVVLQNGDSIPVGSTIVYSATLFAKISFYNMATSSSCQLTEVKTKIPKNNSITSFEYCFQRCRNLTTIPTGLFDNCTQVTNFRACFSGCTNLTAIPTGLFDNCARVTRFDNCFRNCITLTAIPTGLFDNCTQVTRFDECFYWCTNLTAIPTGLFDNCTQVTLFSFCFYRCTNLTSVPTGLFDNCTRVTIFRYCFCECTNLTAIPTGLFDNCTQVTDFIDCFYGCISLISAVPELWIRSNVAYSTGCYYNCTNAANYADIPSAWK